jgi:small-conductance mechanosensitive channel
MQAVLDHISQFVSTQRMSLLWPAAIFLGVLLAGLVTRKVIFARLRRFAARTESQFDDIAVESLHTPALLWIVILAIYAATELSSLPRNWTTWSGKILMALLIVSLTIALAKLAGRLVRFYGSRMEGALPVSTVTEVVASLVIGILGVLVLLHTLGVSIVPMLGALGVGGLAIALALQDTLSNFFAGFYLSLAGQIRVGDFVQLETGQKGYVTDIGWRSTTLRERLNNLIVIPNSKLAQTIVTNYHLPMPWMMMPIRVGVSYDSDPVHVERVLQEVLEEAAREIPEFASEPAPCVRFMPGFGEYSLDFTLICYVTDYEAQFFAQHELRKRVFARLAEERIKIPFPARTIEITQAKGTVA